VSGVVSERVGVNGGYKMKKCIIIGGGDFTSISFPTPSFIIACDSGLNHLIKKKITPDLIIGDFDSLGYVPKGAILLPTEKDVTDINAAINYALEKKFTDFEIYGCLGGNRISHTIANIQLLISLTKKSCNCVLHGDKTTITAMGKGEKYYENIAFKNKYISVFAYTETATVTLSGLKYELDTFTLSNSNPLGVSNEFTDKPARIIVHSGMILIVSD
jgi:thiamine pyrophosphokinase